MRIFSVNIIQIIIMKYSLNIMMNVKDETKVIQYLELYGELLD